jgi:predicted nucleic acid-binding protein
VRYDNDNKSGGEVSRPTGTTVYMERAVDALKRKGVKINEQLLSHLSPLGWEHINLTGDYIWKSNRIPASGKFRRLRPAKVGRSKNNLNVQ